MHLLGKLMKCAVRIEAKLSKGGIATGSGFAYSFAEQESGLPIPAIVTNKHVIKDTVEVSLPISVANSSSNATAKFEVITYPIR